MVVVKLTLSVLLTLEMGQIGKERNEYVYFIKGFSIHLFKDCLDFAFQECDVTNDELLKGLGVIH